MQAADAGAADADADADAADADAAAAAAAAAADADAATADADADPSTLPSHYFTCLAVSSLLRPGQFRPQFWTIDPFASIKPEVNFIINPRIDLLLNSIANLPVLLVDSLSAVFVFVSVSASVFSYL